MLSVALSTSDEQTRPRLRSEQHALLGRADDRAEDDRAYEVDDERPDRKQITR
jgi:hypothetical protein